MPIVACVVCESTQVIHSESNCIVGILTGLLHAFVVLHPELVVNWSLSKFALAVCLVPRSSCLVLVLVAPIEVRVCSTELRKFIASEDLLDLFVI